jgi:glycosyltransferase involved in cell wall biosynthesis
MPADASAAETMRQNLGILPGVTVVETAGRLTAVKDQETLIRAVAECVRQGERLFLVLLGEGELRADLETLCVRLGIADNVRFTGWKPDVARFIAACDLFCLPSRNEGMGKVLVEAMALGKPIIASDVGGIPDLVRPGENGLLVPVGDVPAWTRAIKELVNDPAARCRMGEAGRRIAPAYGVESMIKQIDELYAKLLSDQCVQPKPETAS